MKDVDRHLFFDKVKSLGIDSCLYEIPKNDLVDDMKLWPSVTFPMCTVTSSKRRETSLGKSCIGLQLCDFLVGQVTTGTEAQFWL